MAIAKTRIMDPWKAKRWFPIYCPKYLKGIFIGETPAVESKNVIGREVEISLAALTGDMKKQSMQLKFKITGLEGNNALTEVKKFEISPAYIRRQIRKGRDRIDDSFILKTADKKEVVIKPFFITKNKVNNSKKTLLRKLARQELGEYIAKTNFSEIVQDLISTKLQKTLGNSMRKVCPLRSCEIRVIEVIEAPKSEVTAEKPAEVEIAKEVKEIKTEEKPAVEKTVSENQEKAKEKPAKKQRKKAKEEKAPEKSN